jgi:hypothetical protein
MPTRFAAALAGTVVAAAVVVATPTVAAAHHADVTATAVCATASGGWIVSGTSTSWLATDADGDGSSVEGGAWVDDDDAGWRGLHGAIAIEWSVDGTTWTPVTGGSYEPSGGARPSFEYSFGLTPEHVGDATAVQVRANPQGRWGPKPGTGELSGTGGPEEDRVASTTLPSGCEVPVPSVAVLDECATSGDQTGIVVGLANDGSAPVTFTVPGGSPEVVTIGAGQPPAEVFVPVDEDADWSVTVTATGGFSEELTGHRDCVPDEPVASVSLGDACAESEGVDGITLLLDNSAGTDAVTLEVPDVGAVVVLPGEVLELFVPVAEGAAYAITVPGAGTVEGVRDCDETPPPPDEEEPPPPVEEEPPPPSEEPPPPPDDSEVLGGAIPGPSQPATPPVPASPPVVVGGATQAPAVPVALPRTGLASVELGLVGLGLLVSGLGTTRTAARRRGARK